MTERRPKASEVESKASGQVASGPGRLRPDIREVARLAGVSIATVSRAFNKPDSLRPETKARVLRAANQINYIPDSAARALVSSRTRRIGAVIPTINDSIFAQFVEALQQRLAEAGYALLLGVSDFNSGAEARELRGLIEGGVDAVLLCGAARDESVYELLTSRGVPYLN
jgi:LacI family transcriptional regulator